MKYKIEKNIPLNGQRQRGIYPFAEMQIGDSFFVSVDDSSEIDNKRRIVHSQANNWALRSGKDSKFSTRKEKGGFRIWRTK